MVKPVVAITLCLAAGPLEADCLTLPDATPPTAEAAKLAERLAGHLPLYSLSTEARSISACGTSVYLEFTSMLGEPPPSASDRPWLPDAKRVVCVDFATKKFLRGGGSVKGIFYGQSSPSSFVFDLCKVE